MLAGYQWIRPRRGQAGHLAIRMHGRARRKKRMHVHACGHMWPSVPSVMPCARSTVRLRQRALAATVQEGVNNAYASLS